MSVLDQLRGTELKNAGFILDQSSGYRIADDGAIMRIASILDEPTGFRIADDGQIMRVSPVLDAPTGYRIDEDGSIFEIDSQWISDKETGLRVGPDGSLNKRGFLGDQRVQWSSIGGAQEGSNEASDAYEAREANSVSGPDYNPITVGESWEVELKSRRIYAKALIISAIAFLWVYLFDGWRIAALIPAYYLFAAFLNHPRLSALRPEPGTEHLDALYHEKSKDLGVPDWIEPIVGPLVFLFPFPVFIYLMLTR